MVARVTFVVAALLLAGLASVSGLGGFSDFPNEVLDFIKEKDWSSGVLTMDETFEGTSRNDEELFLLKKLHVWPRLESKFTDQLLKLKEEMRDTKGIRHFQVSRSLADSYSWIVCEAWKSKAAFLDYIKKPDTVSRKTCDYIKEQHIRVELATVTPFAEATGKAMHRSDDSGRIMEDLKSILTSYFEKAQDEEELVILKAAKVDLDDFSVVVYAEFASRQGLEEHIRKPYFKQLKEQVFNKNILKLKAPLRIITSSKYAE